MVSVLWLRVSEVSLFISAVQKTMDSKLILDIFLFSSPLSYCTWTVSGESLLVLETWRLWSLYNIGNFQLFFSFYTLPNSFIFSSCWWDLNMDFKLASEVSLFKSTTFEIMYLTLIFIFIFYPFPPFIPSGSLNIGSVTVHLSHHEN